VNLKMADSRSRAPLQDDRVEAAYWGQNGLMGFAAPSFLGRPFAQRTVSLMNLDHYGIEVENPAGLVLLDCTEVAAAVAEIVQPLSGYKRGRRSFARARPVWHRPPRLDCRASVAAWHLTRAAFDFCEI
jgi:hypothetical protein